MAPAFGKWKVITAAAAIVLVVLVSLSATPAAAQEKLVSGWSSFRPGNVLSQSEAKPLRIPLHPPKKIEGGGRLGHPADEFRADYGADPHKSPATPVSGPAEKEDEKKKPPASAEHGGQDASEETQESTDRHAVGGTGQLDDSSAKGQWGSKPEEDTFADFVKGPGCNFTTQQLHYAFEPKCKDRASLMSAMGGGGRHGVEQPYASLGCDFTWFNPEQVCKIMSRFDRLHFIGDSLMRQLVVAFHALIRKDLVEGGRQTWRDDNPEDQDCRCRTLFAKGSKCFWWEAIDTDSILELDPKSIPCKQKIGSISLQSRLAWPLPDDTWESSVAGLTEKHKEGDRDIYILGHGTWNEYNVNATHYWIEAFEDAWREPVPWYFDSPRLFISPSALSENKPTRYLEKGNNIMVQRYVHEIGQYVEAKGYDHMAFYNMTIQSKSEDGTVCLFVPPSCQALMDSNISSASMQI